MTTLEKLEELVYKGFEKTDRRLDQRFEETDRRLDQRFEETDRRLDQRFEETDRRLDQRFQETHRLIKDTERLQNKNAHQLEDLKKQLTGLTKSLGLFAESMVHPGAARLFAGRGIVLTGIYSRSREQRNGGTMEIDVLGTGPEAVVAIEVKLRLELPEVRYFLRQLADFFEYFPRFRGLRLYGAVAGMSVDEGVARFAYKSGLFVLMPAGENMKIINDEKFVPGIFGETRALKGRKKK